MYGPRAASRSFFTLRTSIGAFVVITLLYIYGSQTTLPPGSKRYTPADLDNDGVPDFCPTINGETGRCILSDGSFRTISSMDPLPVQDDGALSLRPNGVLPSGKKFESDNGTKWKIEYVGNITYTGELGELNLVGDKCRSGQVGEKVIWNCGDMWCNFNWTLCGFAMGPAMYGTDSVFVINTTGIVHIHNNDFVMPWSGDPEPEPPSEFWGMDMSNVAPINDTHGVVYAFEVWRGTGKDLARGNCVSSVTLGEHKPIATRLGPLLTGPNAVQMGMLAIMRAGDYIYIYSAGGFSGLVVTRVRASDDVFDYSKYESLLYRSEYWSPGVPDLPARNYGMVTAGQGRKFACLVYGSVFYSNYLRKYVIVCNIYTTAVNMYTSETPYGPWSEAYGLLRGWEGYGPMVHPMYSPGGSHKEFYFSQGPNTGFHMFKVAFDYD